MKNILVTGGTGFIGKHFVEMLRNSEVHRSSRIIIITDAEVEGFECIRHENYTFPEGMLEKKGLDRIDTVYHLGAYTPKKASKANDIDKSISNINNTQKLLKRLVEKPAKLIFASTIDVYGHVAGVIDENSLTNPQSLYGYSKLFCEKMLEQWSAEAGVVLQILRLGHIYGPGEDAYQKLIPNSIKKILNAEPVTIWSSGNEKRSFLFITDACRMLMKASELNKYVEPVNLVSATARSVRQIVETIVEISETDTEIKIENKTNMSDKDFVFDASKMSNYLGVEEMFLKEGLRLEYNYFKRGISL